MSTALSITYERLSGVGLSVAATATAGSLWFSEGMGLWPCELCWFQRIFMYPLVLIFGVSLVQTSFRPHAVTLVLSGLGLLTAGYHLIIQFQETLLSSASALCSSGGGCSAIQYQLPVLGLTIPSLAFIAFGLTAGVSLALWRQPV
jgi:disulfide bond formation protein DsbB